MREEFPNDIPEGKITHLHLYSDNAGQHFQSIGIIECFTSFTRGRGGATTCMYVYSFGAPGHEKGFFDGLGDALEVYETKDKPSVGAHLRDVNRQAAASARPAESDDGDYSPAN